VKSNTEWEEWGKQDPLFGVAAWPGREKGGANPWTEEDFYATGATDWADYRSQWEHYGLDHTSCLEIGCGAGRLTEALSTDFQTVHGVDISAEILELARKRIPADSVHFHHTDGLVIPLPDSSVTAVLCTFVFQHFDDRKVAARYLAEIRRVMAAGATMMLQMPMYESPVAPSIFRSMYRLQWQLGQARASARRRLMKRGIGAPIMRGLKYEISWIQKTLTAMGFEDIQIRMFRVRSNGDSHSFVLARKTSRGDAAGTAR
jgi:SAM-dependent methyltransferase